jgi:hypothetical protein
VVDGAIGALPEPNSEQAATEMPTRTVNSSINRMYVMGFDLRKRYTWETDGASA